MVIRLVIPRSTDGELKSAVKRGVARISYTRLQKLLAELHLNNDELLYSCAWRRNIEWSR
jgi:hypothetical protein